MNSLPRLYGIADIDTLKVHGIALREFAGALREAEVGIVQLRYKSGTPEETLDAAATLVEVFRGTATRLILNDRPDLASLARFDGVHLGQSDLSPEDARRILGPQAIIGLSTHTPAQIQAAIETPTDYLAIGPIFSTTTKPDAEPPVGLETLRHIRTLTAKPLVAIGGITLANAPQVLAAGADSIAIISALFSPTASIAKTARAFLDQSS